MGAEPRHLAEVLAELASLTPDPFDVVELVQLACERAVEALDVDGAVITLTVDGSPLALVGAAGQSGAAETLLAIDLTPCSEAVATGRVVTFDHRFDAARFPEFSATAGPLGLRHSLAMPLRNGEQILGMLSLMRLRDQAFDEGIADGARQITEVVVARVLQAETLRAAMAVREQLEHALQARVVIEQAKGMVAAELGVSIDEALALIRTFSRSQHLRLADVSGDIVSRKLPMMLLRS